MPSQSSQLLPVLTFWRSVEVPLLHTQLPGSQRRRSHFARFGKVGWLVLAESLVLCLTSASIGLALSTVLVPTVRYCPALGLSAIQIVELAAAF